MANYSDIITWFKSRSNHIIGNNKSQLTITAPRGIVDARENHISFITKKVESQFINIINNTTCKLIILEEALLTDENKKKLPVDISFIISINPKSDIIDVSQQFFGFQKKNEKTIIDPRASIDKSVSIGNASIIDAFAVIEEDVKIGTNCIIGANTVIKKGTIIQNNVEIGSCNVIGGTGFGYAKQAGSNEYEQFPHFGIVILKDNVHIGNNTCIDRGSLSDTIIEEGVKIDNLVHIAHNVKVGKNSVVIANSMIAGSVIIEENCWVAPCATVRNAITIGKDSTIGLGSTVTKSVLAGQVVMGNPGLPIEDFLILRKHQKTVIKENSK